jgi:hypothetical protein
LFKSNRFNRRLDAKQILSNRNNRFSCRNNNSSILRTSHDNSGNGHNIRRSSDNIESKEQRKGFFSESAAHSKDIGKIISAGFGTDSELSGHCYYQKGELERKDPQFSVEDIALAEEHLRKGYSEIWNRKMQLESEVLKLYDANEGIIKQYEERIQSLIPDKFNAKMDYDSGIILTGPIYYQKSVNACLFEQINKHLNNVPLSRLTYRHGDEHKLKKIVNNQLQDVKPVAIFMEPSYYLADGEKEVLEEFWKVFESMQSDEQLIRLVENYNGLQLQVSKLNFNDFSNDIDAISKTIKEGRSDLKGSCKHCPKKSVIDIFFG